MSESSKNSRLKKKGSKKKKIEELDESETDSEEELDLTKECFPIAHYMSDRAEMISQMFSVIKGGKLKAMLPPLLKDYDVEKLKLQCLDQLLGMSEKRILSILDGEILDSSSESEVATGSEPESADGSGSSSESSNEASVRTGSNKNKRKSHENSSEKPNKVLKVEEDAGQGQGKTLLEILELEMRARAIRALLKQQQGGAEKEKSPTNDDVVDLTAEDEFPTVIKQEPPSTEQEQSFENKVVKSVEKSTKEAEAKEKSQKEAEAKKRKLLAQSELQNKLIKKKTYRTQQQRIENLDEDLRNEKNKSPVPEKEIEVLPEVKKEPTEIVIDDPEEGEVSSEEEAAEPVVKIEKPDSPEPDKEEAVKPMDGERIAAIDDGEFVPDKNLQLEHQEEHQPDTLEDGSSNTKQDKSAAAEDNIVELDDTDDESREDSQTAEPEESENVKSIEENANQIEEEEETSWRGRWLKRDHVQQVVKSSKICGLVKKRIVKKKQIALAAMEENSTSAPEKNEEIPPVEAPVNIEGTVGEYEKLFGKVVEDTASENIEESAANPEDLGDMAVSTIANEEKIAEEEQEVGDTNQQGETS